MPPSVSFSVQIKAMHLCFNRGIDILSQNKMRKMVLKNISSAFINTLFKDNECVNSYNFFLTNKWIRMINNDILELLLSFIHNFLFASSGYLITGEKFLYSQWSVRNEDAGNPSVLKRSPVIKSLKAYLTATGSVTDGQNKMMLPPVMKALAE